LEKVGITVDTILFCAIYIHFSFFNEPFIIQEFLDLPTYLQSQLVAKNQMKVVALTCARVQILRTAKEQVLPYIVANKSQLIQGEKNPTSYR